MAAVPLIVTLVAPTPPPVIANALSTPLAVSAMVSSVLAPAAFVRATAAPVTPLIVRPKVFVPANAAWL